MSIPHARRMNLIALALLITALIAFVAFHLLPVTAETDLSPTGMEEEEFDRGWILWKEVWEVLKERDVDNTRGTIGSTAFLTGSLLMIAAPFLVWLLRNSRIGWWLATLTSGMVLIGLGGIIVMNYIPPDPLERPGPAIFCLMGAMLLNFSGLLFIRRETPAEPAVES